MLCDLMAGDKVILKGLPVYVNGNPGSPEGLGDWIAEVELSSLLPAQIVELSEKCGEISHLVFDDGTTAVVAAPRCPSYDGDGLPSLVIRGSAPIE